MLTRGNDVLRVKVGRLKHVKHGELAAQSLIKAPNSSLRSTGTTCRTLNPSIPAALEDAKRLELRMSPAPIDPSQQVLEVPVDRERPWLVDDSEAGVEADQQDPSTTVM